MPSTSGEFWEVKTTVVASGAKAEYKFLIKVDRWESTSNRIVTFEPLDIAGETRTVVENVWESPSQVKIFVSFFLSSIAVISLLTTERA